MRTAALDGASTQVTPDLEGARAGENLTTTRSQRGQSLTEWMLIVTSVALVAMLGFGVMKAGVGTQSASMAQALAGGPAQIAARPREDIAADLPILADFDAIGRGPEAGQEAQDDSTSIAFLQGFASGLIDTLWEELSAVLSPVDTAIALAELGRLLATQFLETVRLLYDELIVKQLDKLINGNEYERGFVLGNQVSPFKAVSVLAKATGAAKLAKIAKARKQLEIGDDGIARVNGRRPINYRYAGKTHPSGVKFSKEGFPDFSPYTQAEVDLDGLTGNYRIDAKAANKASGFDRTPEGYVWHHVEDGRTMQLIPKDIHKAVRHTGGSAIIRSLRAGGGSQ